MVEPPSDPVQDHVQGPVPETAEAVPEVQRFAEGAEFTVVPLAEPQRPSTLAGKLPVGAVSTIAAETLVEEGFFTSPARSADEPVE